MRPKLAARRQRKVTNQMTHTDITFYNITGQELIFNDLRDGDIFITPLNDHIAVKGVYPGQEHLPNIPPPNFFDPRWPTLYARCANLMPVKRLNVVGLIFLRPQQVVVDETALGVLQQRAGMYD